jgi:predicted metal-binding membrane protein
MSRAVAASPAAASLVPFAALCSRVRDRPQWWTVAISACAWLALLAAPHAGTDGVAGPHHASMHAGPSAIGVDAMAWMVMVAAMMFPLILGPIEVTAARSLWRRRHRAIAGFLIGYSGCWLIPGVCLALLFALLRDLGFGPSAAAAAAAFAIAGLWQGTKIREQAVRACHRTTPLAPSGWRADLDCLRYGWMTAVNCVVSCWPVMIACALGGHATFTMMAAGSIGVVERYAVRPDQRILRGALVMLAAAQFVAA